MSESDLSSIVKPESQGYEQHFWRNWLAFCILGTLNNLGYVVVGSAAQSIVDDFDVSNLLGLITWANVGVGLFIRILNTYLEGSSIGKRIIINGVFMIIGFSGLVISQYISFYFALVSILFVGGSSSFGESATLGYLRKYPAEMVSGWSSGTGWAGVGGSGLYLGLVAIGLSNQMIFLLMIPLVLIYWIAFFYILIEPKQPSPSHTIQDPSSRTQIENPEEPSSLIGSRRNSFTDSTDGTITSATAIIVAPSASTLARSRANSDLSSGISNQTSVRYININANNFSTPSFISAITPSVGSLEDENRSLLSDPNDSVDSVTVTIHSRVPDLQMSPPETQIQRFVRCSNLVGWWAIQLLLVYFFEYYIQTGGADKANKNVDDSNNWEYENSFALLAFCYQLGVLLSRSSLQFFKVTVIEVVTVLQGLNFVFWLVQDSFKLVDIWFQFVIMVYVGLLGGLSYVNTFYIILNGNWISGRDKEYCINLTTISINLGIILSAGFTLIAENTWLSDE